MRGLIVIALVCCVFAVMMDSVKGQGAPQSAPVPHPSDSKGIEGRYRRAAQGGGAGGGAGAGFGFKVGGGFGGEAGAGGEGGK